MLALLESLLVSKRPTVWGNEDQNRFVLVFFGLFFFKLIYILSKKKSNFVKNIWMYAVEKILSLNGISAKAFNSSINVKSNSVYNTYSL